MKMPCHQRGVLLLALLLIVIPCCDGFTPGSTALSSLPNHVTKVKLANVLLASSTTNSSAEGDLSSSSLSSSSSSLANYHLIWSAQFWKKMLLTTLFLWLLQRSSTTIQFPQLQTNGFLFNALLPTLSSACCWIQVLLNTVTALGCAGFNTYLGPLRPLFLGLLTQLTLVTRSHTKPWTVLFRWTIALLPELLHLWNTTATRQKKKKISGSRGVEETKTTNDIVTIHLDCPTMGCVACIQNVNSSLYKALQSTPFIVEIQQVNSWLLDSNQKGGKVKVQFSTTRGLLGGEEEEEEVFDPQILVSALEQTGFPCTVVDVERNHHHDPHPMSQ